MIRFPNIKRYPIKWIRWMGVFFLGVVVRNFYEKILNVFKYNMVIREKILLTLLLLATYLLNLLLKIDCVANTFTRTAWWTVGGGKGPCPSDKLYISSPSLLVAYLFSTYGYCEHDHMHVSWHLHKKKLIQVTQTARTQTLSCTSSLIIFNKTCHIIRTSLLRSFMSTNKNFALVVMTKSNKNMLHYCH